VSERFGRAGAAGYDRGFGSVSGQFVPALLHLAHVVPGQHVLDIATGTGAAALAALAIVGPTGRVVATDLSAAMLARAREQPGLPRNLCFAVADGQALGFADQTFDAVLCAMGLMLFGDPARGLAEFRRVLRDGTWAAASVNTTPQRAFVTRIDAIIARHVPERSAIASQYFSLGDPARLMSLFVAAGFRDVETSTEIRRFAFPSFAAYFAPVEAGVGPTGQAFITLPADIRQRVREDARRELEGDKGTGGPVEVVVEILYCAGRK
jgi:ubiquinone/menaquinone biosynthesis C-methylase UbiE